VRRGETKKILRKDGSHSQNGRTVLHHRKEEFNQLGEFRWIEWHDLNTQTKIEKKKIRGNKNLNNGNVRTTVCVGEDFCFVFFFFPVCFKYDKLKRKKIGPNNTKHECQISR